MIRFGESVCGNSEEALSREWLQTNALGGYACSTLCGANTRRYHGLLVAAMNPPVGRVVLLSKLDETLVAADGRFDLATNLYPDTLHPRGYQLLKGFRLDPFPVFRWTAGNSCIEKTLWMPPGENTTVIEYTLLTGAPCSLELRPLIAFRDYHATTHANPALNLALEHGSGFTAIQPYPDQPTLFFGHSGSVAASGEWYRRFQYPREQERGLDHEEDLFQPFVLTLDLQPGTPVRIVCSTQWPASAEKPERPGDVLDRAAQDFLVRRADHISVIAGYPWFNDWGRDTMISLPGLTLGQPAVARSILQAFIPYLHQGLLPNCFPDHGQEPEYNTIDATFWFTQAIALLDAREYLPQLQEIIEWHERGTLFDIHVDPEDGLISGSAPGVQLTWMDAKVNGRVITPRNGKPIEIQALWHDALQLAARWTGDAKYTAMARRTRESVLSKFWNEEAGCLYDAIDGDVRDPSIRPNQLFAAGLLSRQQGESMLQVVERELLTPYGLRTLAPSDPRYIGCYEGPQEQRDAAYHQGTVWPWLLGPYARAVESIRGKPPAGLFIPFEKHLLEAGIGQISEIFDGDPPHAPRGCIAQAWSVAELRQLRP